MGGVRFSIRIARTRADGLSLLAFHRHVWRTIAAELDVLDFERHQMAFGYYVAAKAYDGLGDDDARTSGTWSRDDSELSFSFDDHAGFCPVSMNATYHWASIAAALCARSGTLDAPGWTVAKPDPGALERQLVLSSDGFAYASQHMCGVECRNPGEPLLDDDERIASRDSEIVRWSELTLDERDELEWVALTGYCYCDFCTTHRPEPLLIDVAAARAAWDLLETGRQRDLEAQVATAVRAWNWSDFDGPPELAVLSDWLMESGAKLDSCALASMVHRRVGR